MKKATIMLLVLLMVLSLASCKSQSKVAPDTNTKMPSRTSAPIYDEAEDDGAIYASELIAMPNDGVYLHSAVKSGNYIFMYGTSVDGDEIYRLSLESKAVERIPFTTEYSVQAISATPNESMCVLCLNEGGEYVLLTLEGESTWTEVIFPQIEEYSDSFIVQINCVKNGYIAFTTKDILALNKKGELQKDIETCLGQGLCIPQNDGGAVIATISQNGIDEAAATRIIFVDENFNIVESYDSAFQFTAFYDDPESAGDCILAKSGNNIYRFNFKDDSRDALVNVFTSSMSTSSLICLGGNLYFSLSNDGPTFWQPSSGETPTTLTLATYKTDIALHMKILDYNKSGGKYKINVIDYAAYDINGEAGEGLNKLRTDIVLGYAPDLYDLSNLPAELYAERGLFEDLKPYFSDDAPVKYEDLVQSAIRVLENNNALYYIAPSFSVVTLCGQPNFVGSKGFWTVDDFIKAVESYNPQDVFGPEMTQSLFLHNIMIYLRNDYINEDTLECRFNDESFQNLLAFTAKLPSQYDASKSTSQGISRVYMGEQPILQWGVGQGGLINMAHAAAAFHDDIEYVGFPTLSNSGGVALSPSSLIGISASSRNKTGAIDFIYYLLSDESQSSFLDFPIVQSSLNEKINYWEEQFLKKETVTLASFYDNAELSISALTTPETCEERKSELLEIISEINCLAIYDDTLFNILLRECQPLFAGDKTVIQVVDNIQSKMQIYVSEQYG